MFKSIATHSGKRWVRPKAPQRNGTRTPLYETERVPPNLLGNLHVAVLGLVGLGLAAAQEKDAKKRSKVRHAGRDLCEVEGLLFVAARAEMRMPLLRYAALGQNLMGISGLEQTRLDFVCLAGMSDVMVTLQALVGIVQTSSVLFAFAGRPGPSRMSLRSAGCFLMELARASRCFAVMPVFTSRILEVLIIKTFQGVPIAYRAAQGRCPVNARG